MDQASLDQATKEMSETNQRCEEIRHQIGKLTEMLKVIDPEVHTWSLDVTLTNLDHHSDPRRSLQIDRPFFNLYDFRRFIHSQGLMYRDGLYECLRIETAQMTHKLLTLLKGEINDPTGTDPNPSGTGTPIARNVECSDGGDGDRNNVQEPETP